jgi:hypothetical protein
MNYLKEKRAKNIIVKNVVTIIPVSLHFVIAVAGMAESMNHTKVVRNHNIPVRNVEKNIPVLLLFVIVAAGVAENTNLQGSNNPPA